MTVLPPGTQVKIGETLSGIITGILIRDGSYVQYEVAWWNGNSRTVAWLDAVEIDRGKPEALEIGFLRKTNTDSSSL